MGVRKFRGVRKEMVHKWQTDAEGLPFHFTESRVLNAKRRDILELLVPNQANLN
eukprot:COSAG02_NODE_8604_length_2508_cov_2.660855_2_plen_54_part_00